MQKDKFASNEMDCRSADIIRAPSMVNQLQSQADNEARIRALPPEQRTVEESALITKIDNYLSTMEEMFPNLADDEVQLPYQMPPNTNKNTKFLPDGYSYETEKHLNWQRVVTYRNATKEICGIAEGVCQQLVDPSLAICRDGACMRQECQPDNFHVLVNCRTKFINWLIAEKEKTESFYLYGKKAIIREDDYGFIIDGNESVDKEKSVIGKSVLRRQLNITTTITDN